jgi:signal transduction histidine kinase
MNPEADLQIRSAALELLKGRLDEIVEEITAILIDSIPSFRNRSGDFYARIREISRMAFENVLLQLNRGRVAVEGFDWGDLQAFELADILRAFRVGSEVAWRSMRKVWEGAGYTAEEYLRASELIWEFYFRAADSVAQNYMEQRQKAIKDFNLLLNRVRVIQDRDELMRQVSDGACDRLGYRRCLLFLYEREMLIPVSARDREDQEWGRRIMKEARRFPISPMAKSLEARAFYERSIQAGRGQEGINVAFLSPGKGSDFLIVPVNPTGSPKGLLYIEANPGTPLTERDREILMTYADTVGMALENTRLYREVQAKRRVMDHLMNRVNTAHEEERARIARELHDSVAQTLLKIIYAGGFALDFLKEDPRLAVDEIEEVQLRAKECLRDLREIMANLRPTSLDILGLQETIVRYAEQFEEEYAINTSLDLRGLEAITPAAELTVFRILQEELANVGKHSGATSVKITSETSQGDFVLSVEDDGVGFDQGVLAAEQESGEHLGLMAIRERAELLGGRMSIDTLPGIGTRVTVRLPIVAGGES